MATKILYIVPPTGKYAGIERVVDEICGELSARCSADLDIDVLFTCTFPDKEIIDRPYRVIQIETRNRRHLVKTIRAVAKAKSYDLIVVPQVEATVVVWASCLGLRRRIVLYLHGNPNLERRSIKAGLLFFAMQTFVLNRLAAVFGISPSQIESFKKSFPSNRPHYWVPNPVRRFDLQSMPADSVGERPVTFVNVGRFCYQKGQDILVRAFAKLHARRPNTRLKIVGYGSEEVDIRAEIARLGLCEAVVIEHHPHSPAPALAHSDVYVSTSRWEGWSLAICEALRFGLPVVSTDCEFGPSDILEDSRLGRLAPLGDEEALVAAMTHYCDHRVEERAHSALRQSYIDRYSAEQVVNRHAEALCRSAQLQAT